MRIVFMGTPEFAARILSEINSWPQGELVGVYTQPDRPAGRGKKLQPPAVKILAEQLGLPLFQPVNFKNDEDLERLRALRPDVLVVAAYGLILPQKVLDIPRLGPYNVHASLLPKYRGAAPIQRAIMNGERVTGVTIMRVEISLDSGPILLQQAVNIAPDDTAGLLFEILAEHGAKLMVGALGMIRENRAAFIPQNSEYATYAPKIARTEEYVDWTRSSTAIDNQIRGIFPSPGARTILAGKELLLSLEPGQAIPNSHGLAPGAIADFDGQALIIACGEGSYRLTRLRPAGRNSMNAAEFCNGYLKASHFPCGFLHGPNAVRLERA